MGILARTHKINIEYDSCYFRSRDAEFLLTQLNFNCRLAQIDSIIIS